MSTYAAQAPRPLPEGPVIAPLPSRAKKGRRKRPMDRRALVWAAAFAIGLGFGVAGYQWVPGVDATFDYWLALVLG